MKTNLMNAVSRTPAAVRPVHHFFTTKAGRLLGVALCYGFLLFIGLTPGVASAGGEKVTLCHVPPGDPNNPQELVVAPSAAKAHLKNHAGDHLGPCAKPPECQTDNQCNDANPCTTDTCTAAGACQHAAVSCDDGNACTIDACSTEQGGCVFVPAPGGTCDDSNACTGADTCNDQGACVGAAITGCCLTDADCNDSNACTADVCNTTTHTCSNTETTPPISAECHIYICDPAVGWVDTDVTCLDDGNSCTADVCNPSTGACEHNTIPPSGTEQDCGDGLDNDCDGTIDSADPDCGMPGGECPCVTSADPIWNSTTALAEFISSYGDFYKSPPTCIVSQDMYFFQTTEPQSVAFVPMVAPSMGFCATSSLEALPIDSMQAQACVQRINALASITPAGTCVPPPPSVCTGQTGYVELPVPENCAAYIPCNRELEYPQELCPTGLLFDATSRLCSPPEQVDCGSRPNPDAF
ncbi:MAG: hypothetical protein U1F76_32065 [Candidatus Competibacteraceae bacterium]